MADFYEMHKRAISAAAPFAERPGDTFRIIVWEPLGPPSAVPESDTATIVTFRRTRSGYEPASPEDAKAIADWNERHKDTPASAFEL